jgi:hypothetical protein
MSEQAAENSREPGPKLTRRRLTLIIMFLSSLIAFAILSQIPRSNPMQILFIGNSLTNYNEMPTMVEKLLESDGSGRRVEVKAHFFGHLDDAVKNPALLEEVKDPKWDFVVLQGAMISTSLSREYSQDPGIELASLARRAGSQVILYVEWPRRGIDESDFSVAQYQRIQRSVPGVQMAPACYTWESTLKAHPKLPAYAEDGNHSRPVGSYIAAVTLYEKIVGPKSGDPKWLVEGVDRKLLQEIRTYAKAANKRVQ